MRRRTAVAAALAGVLALAVGAGAAGDPFGVGTQPTTSSSGDTAGGQVDFTGGGGDADPDAAPVPGSAAAPARPTRQTRTVQVGVAPCAFVPGSDPPYAAMLQDQVRVPPGGWQPVRTYCAGEVPPEPAPPQPDPDVAREVAVFLRAQVRAPRPALSIAPSGGALVNQPGVFWLGDPGAPPTASDEDPLVPGLRIEVELQQPTYVWSWGDGQSGSSGTSRGRAYVQGDTVPAEGRGAPLITHTWAGPGTRQLSVTAVYRVLFRWNGSTQELAPVRATTTRPVVVRAARSELVSR